MLLAKDLDDVDIYGYLDYRAYLRDAYEYRKRTQPGFSYRAFARHAGMRSPNFLKLVIDGNRNLSMKSAEQFAQALELSPNETSFFIDLVGFDQANSSIEKNHFLERIGSYRKHQKVKRLERSAFAYLSHWYYPAIRELAACAAFSEDPEWIANRLFPKISVSQAREALQVLLELGLLIREEDGRLVQGNPCVSTGNEMRSLAIGNFHRQMIERASAAIEDVPQREREISGVTVALNRQRFETLKKRIHELRAEILQLAEDDSAADRVVQFNFQAFPLTSPEETE